MIMLALSWLRAFLGEIVPEENANDTEPHGASSFYTTHDPHK